VSPTNRDHGLLPPRGMKAFSNRYPILSHARALRRQGCRAQGEPAAALAALLTSIQMYSPGSPAARASKESAVKLQLISKGRLRFKQWELPGPLDARRQCTALQSMPSRFLVDRLGCSRPANLHLVSTGRSCKPRFPWEETSHWGQDLCPTPLSPLNRPC
jgi:hypothetical protein